jgi:hypothetical protein
MLFCPGGHQGKEKLNPPRMNTDEHGLKDFQPLISVMTVIARREYAAWARRRRLPA